MLNIGFAATCITPPLGREIPGLFEKRHAQAVADDLWARAAVISDGARTLAFVQVDCLALPDTVVAAARKEAKRLCGLAEEDCLIAATHTHSGGPLVSCLASEADPGYQAEAAARIASAIAQACAARRPALLATAASAAPGVAFNRRFKLRNGLCATHPGKMNPEIVCAVGPEDPAVTILAFRTPEDPAPFGCIVHFACHATHMNGTAFSADYPRWIVDTLRAVYGPTFGVVFLNGACGDVTQVDNRSDRPYEFGPYWCRRTGQAVAGAALQALATADYFADAGLGAASMRIRPAIRDIPENERRAARALLRNGDPSGQNVEAIYARELLLIDKMRRQRPWCSLDLSAVRIGDTAVWTVPAELFQAYALRVREASPFRHTLCVSLVNGYSGYICTPDAFSGAGYENRTARSSFLVPDAGDRVVRAADRLLDVLYERGREEVDALPARLARIEGDDSALNGLRKATRRRSAPARRARR